MEASYVSTNPQKGSWKGRSHAGTGPGNREGTEITGRQRLRDFL